MSQYNQSSIKHLRLAHHLSRPAFAKKVGLTRQHIHNYERGINKPDLATLEKIAGAFDLDIGYFFDSNVSTSNYKGK